MERPRLAHLLCAFLFVAPILAITTPVSAELSGHVAFSTDGLAMSPSSPVEGGDVTFTLSLQNTANIIAEDVVVEFHKNNYQSGQPASYHEIDIDANEFEDVQFVWSNIAWGDGEQTLVIRVNHDDDPKFITQDFSVEGLPNLRFSHFELNPAMGAHENELVEIQIEVENSGNADAPSSHVELTVAGSSISILKSVNALQKGDSIWLNETVNAPAAGSYDVIGTVNADSGDNIVESTAGDNSETRVLTVDTLPDYRHAEGPNVAISSGLDGPWTVTGTIARDGGIGTSTVPLEVRIQDGITLEITSLTFTDADPFPEYSFTIISEDLPDTTPGDVFIEVAIDSSLSVAQSNTFNNVESSQLTIYQEPNVVLTSVSTPDDTTPGSSVEFTVMLQNVGMVAVTGNLTATFDGEVIETKSLTIPASNTGNQGQISVDFSAIAEGMTREIPFTATWTKSPGSYDRLETDNTMTSSVQLSSELKLRFLFNSEDWRPSNPPLKTGTTYIYSIDIVADVGEGSESFLCIDRSTSKQLYDPGTFTFDENNNRHTIICQFTVLEVGQIELVIEPAGTSVQPFAKAWNVERGSDSESGNDEETTSIILFALAGFVALGALIGAIILTRRGLADADRETYDLCPACDGDIEGDEDICPHCDFDLRVGRSKFHDCLDCNSTIPSMLEHCPYCGSEQDLGEHYSKRERKFKPLPAETEEETEVEEEDEDEIVRGYEGFDTHAGDLGFDENQWEGEWDESLSKAEDYFDTKEEERLAAEEDDDPETENIVETTKLSEAMDDLPEHDLDAFLGDVESRKHLSDKEVELTASDANYREELFELTGEDGVLPGQQVNVEAMVDNTVVGNEVRSASSDFGIGDEDSPPVKKSEPKEDDKTPKRRGVRRRKKEE